LGANLVLGFALLGFSLFITLGIGLSSNGQANQQVGQSVIFIWFCCPGSINLPGLAYALSTRRRRFLGGWAVGFLIALLLLGGTLGCIALYVVTLNASY
jgi:hypothetical protein